MHPAFWPYLIGLVPIFLARSWPARAVAIIFGLISIGLGAYYVSTIQTSPDALTGVQQIAPIVIGALVIAFVSLLATYFVDKRYARKN